MNRHLTEANANDLVDGLLSAAEFEAFELHLADCASCRETVTGLRDLIAAAAALPERSPQRDLLPGIRAATRRTQATDRRWMAMAASFLLVVAAAVGTLIVRQQAPSSPAGPSASPILEASRSDALTEIRAAEMEFVAAAAVLLETLEARRDELPADALATLENNLELIDRAIAEVESSLGTEGEEARVGHVLTALHQTKMQLLWKASRLSS